VNDLPLWEGGLARTSEAQYSSAANEAQDTMLRAGFAAVTPATPPPGVSLGHTFLRVRLVWPRDFLGVSQCPSLDIVRSIRTLPPLSALNAAYNYTPLK